MLFLRAPEQLKVFYLSLFDDFRGIYMNVSFF